jgi:TonB family protein
MRHEEEGLNLLGILVRADGTLASSSILLSSGHKDLDRTLLSALSKCRFKPGTVDGKPVEMWFVLDWLWTLEDHWGQSDLVEKLATAAANGGLDARFQLSLMLTRRAKTDDERNRATLVLRDAAERGHPMAQFHLGRRYELGNGVSVDVEEALRWYEKAAAQGNVLAIERLRLGELPR